MDSSKFNLSILKKAASLLESGLKEEQSALVRDAVIQRFEYTYELAWKSMRRYFRLNNQLVEDNVQNLFREAGRQGLIDSVERWFDYQRARNLSSHVYDENVADEVYKMAALLSKDVNVLIQRWEKILGRTD